MGADCSVVGDQGGGRAVDVLQQAVRGVDASADGLQAVDDVVDS
jgi:hypothetical protein